MLLNKVSRFGIKNIIATFLISAIGIAAQAKTTVCSMNLNSPDELEIMQKHLGTDDFEYIELGENPETSCNKQFKCDIFMVSAHFGGIFFGEKFDKYMTNEKGEKVAQTKRYEVGLDSLEKLSCSNKCGNIFNAKQVYMFGCNTLNGRKKDDRTPEVYVDVLRADNYGTVMAQHLAANIYSSLGGTYHERMQQLFPQASQIFGFYSKAPKGKDIRKYLDESFATLKPGTYADTLVAGSEAANQWSQSLSNGLKRFSFTTTVGKPNNDSLICKVLNAPHEYEKLKTIREAFDRGEGLKIVTSLVHFFNSLGIEHLDSRELGELDKIKRNKAVKEQLLTFITTADDAFSVVRLEILEMMTTISWVTKVEAGRMAGDIVNKSILKVFKDPGYLASLYPARNLAKVDFKSFPEEYWNNIQSYNLVDFFNAFDDFVIERMVRTLQTTNDPKIAEAAGKQMLRIQLWARAENQVKTSAKLLARFPQPEIQKLVRDLEQSQKSSSF